LTVKLVICGAWNEPRLAISISIAILMMFIDAAPQCAKADSALQIERYHVKIVAPEPRMSFMRFDKYSNLRLILIMVAFSFPATVQSQTTHVPRFHQVLLLENWLLSHRGADSGLPISHIGDPRFKDWCFTYDAAVAALAFIAVDRSGEAARIIDFYINMQHTHRLGGIIEAVAAVPPYGVQDWSVRTGANIWLGLASYHLFKSTHEKKYLTFSSSIADFAVELQDRRRTSPTYGGVTMGPPGDPSYEADQHFDYDSQMPRFEQVFSTEATVDCFALFNMLERESGMMRFQAARDRCLVWLKKVAWNTVEHRFNRGFHQEPDYAVATDVHAWAISALGAARLDTIERGGAEHMIRFIEQNCQSTVSYRLPDGRRILVKGFDFVDHGALKHYKRPTLVSPEWTFQMANAYKRLSDDFGAIGDTNKAEFYTKKRKDLLTQLMAMASIQGNSAGFPYSTLGGAPVGHEYGTPVKGSLSMIGVAYGILALTGYDPLRIP
jgi:hypothetical protein